MKANNPPRVKADPSIERELREHATLINLMADGRLAGTNNATTAAPTAGANGWGDFVKNSAPTVQGTAGSKYVVVGWICVAAGTPGTWEQCRVLTGN